MEHFNKNTPLNQKLKKEIEDFFSYKWTVDKNHAFQDPDFENIVEQLPEDLIYSIYIKFLYGKFLHTYSKNLFYIPKRSKHRYARYTWLDQAYRDFLMSVLQGLEPILKDGDTMLYQE